jgi:hypothetical protein
MLMLVVVMASETVLFSEGKRLIGFPTEEEAWEYIREQEAEQICLNN